MHDLTPDFPAADSAVARMKPLTPAQARADVLASLEEAIAQCEKDAARLGGSTHGRYLSALAAKWRGVVTCSKAAGA